MRALKPTEEEEPLTEEIYEKETNPLRSLWLGGKISWEEFNDEENEVTNEEQKTSPISQNTPRLKTYISSLNPVYVCVLQLGYFQKLLFLFSLLFNSSLYIDGGLVCVGECYINGRRKAKIKANKA